MLVNHLIAFAAGYILDMIIGDPHFIPHPVCAIGRFISFLEKKLYPAGKNSEGTLNNVESAIKAESGLNARSAINKKSAFKAENTAEMTTSADKAQFACGVILTAIVIIVVFAFFAIILFLSYKAGNIPGIICEAVMTGQILAARSLERESMKVYKALKAGEHDKAAALLSMIVGRDTDVLDESGIIRAAVETVAENTSDGVTAPMIVTALFGPAAGFAYKAVNTMDSMIGYKSERYIFFGRAAARTDDAVNWLLARAGACIMICAAFVIEFAEKIVSRSKNVCISGSRAFRIYRRDRNRHDSPNSGQTESACAGALGVRLAGDAVYGGRIIHKPQIGDDDRSVTIDDIRRADELMLMTAFLCWILCMMVILVATMVT